MAISCQRKSMGMTLKVVVPPHPLIAHWLTVLRSRSTPAPVYSTALEELGRWLTYEALREWLPFRKEILKTPYGEVEGTFIEFGVPLISILLLPGGLDLWEGGRKVLPNSQRFINDVPKDVASNEGVIIYIDQIATGERLKSTLDLLKKQSVESKRLRIITALASNPGLKTIGERFPDLTIYTSSIDPEITENGEISPGIGNPFLRLNTRVKSTN